MGLFCLLLVITAFVHPPWAVAPLKGNDGIAVPKPQINGHMPVNSAPFAGSMNMGGSNVGIDFSGDDMRLYDPSTGATVSEYNDNNYNNKNQRPITYGPAHGQTYAPAYGQHYEPAQGTAGNINYKDPEEEEDEEHYYDEDAEYAEALAELKRAEAYAAQMAAKCNQKYIQNNTRLRNKCFAERDQANTARDAAKENLEAIKERMESAAPAENESEDADNEYAAAKEKMDKAEKYATEMSAKCLELNIQRNIRARDDCYAKRNQAQRDRDAARDEFYAIRDRLQYGAAASNAYIPTFTGPVFTGPAFTGSAFTGPAFTGPAFTGPAFTGPTFTGPTFAGPAFTAPFFTPNPGFGKLPTDSFSNGFGNQNNGLISGSMVNNQFFHGETNINDVRNTYRMKIQVKNVNGACVEHWQIGLTRLGDKLWEPAFDVKCKGSGMRNRINKPGILLVSNPDDSFCFFSNNPNFLTVIKDGICTKYQYDNDGNKKSASELDTKECGQEKKTMWDLLKKEHIFKDNNSKGASGQTSNTDKIPGSTSALQNPHNTHDKQNGATTNSGIGSPSTLNNQNSYTSNMNNNNVVTNIGPHYTVRLTNTMNERTCENKIKITRSTDGREIEEFTLPCLGQRIGSRNDGEEVLIGGPDDKFCAFTMTKIPESLIVIEDGKCMERKFSDSTVVVSTFKESDCKDIKDRIKKIEDKVKSRVFNSRLEKTKLNADINSLEEELAKKLNEITPISTNINRKPSKQTGPGTPNQTSSGIIPPGSTGGPKDKIPGSTSAPQKPHNTHGKLNSVTTNTGIGSPSTLINQNSYTSNMNNNDMVTNIGPHYTVRLTNTMNGRTCENKIKITRSTDGGKIEEFTLPCLGQRIGSRNDGEEVFIGGPDDKFCAFTMTKIPESLIVIEDGKCMKRKYSDSSVVVSTFKESDCKDIKDRIKKIEEKVKSRVFSSRLEKTKLNADIDSLEEELAKKLNEITPISININRKPSKQTDPGTPNQTSSGIIPPGSTGGPKAGTNSNPKPLVPLKEEPSYLQRILDMIPPKVVNWKIPFWS